MWLRRATLVNYGRVLRASVASTAPPKRAFLHCVFDMQLRARTTAAAPIEPLKKVSPTAKRSRSRSSTATANAITAASTKDDDVRDTEAVPARRSTRKRVKTGEADASTVAVESPNGSINTNDEDADQKKARPKRKTLVVKRGKDGRPENWEKVMQGIKEMRAAQVADVDVAGAETMFEKGAFPPHIARFHVLISAMLSSQTKDPVNAAAMKRLIARGLTMQDMLNIDEKELAQLLHPVGFFNNKARYIKQVAQILLDRAEDPTNVDIPDTFDELVKLPGVGPKMAHLIMSCAWNNTVGICVDTHVHRISNRLGWVNTWNKKNPKAQDPEKTRKELEDWLPREHWGPINVMLVGFGQTVCFPRGPKCTACKVQDLCPSAY